MRTACPRRSRSASARWCPAPPSSRTSSRSPTPPPTRTRAWIDKGSEQFFKIDAREATHGLVTCRLEGFFAYEAVPRSLVERDRFGLDLRGAERQLAAAPAQGFLLGIAQHRPADPAPPRRGADVHAAQLHRARCGRLEPEYAHEDFGFQRHPEAAFAVVLWDAVDLLAKRALGVGLEFGVHAGRGEQAIHGDEQ